MDTPLLIYEPTLFRDVTWLGQRLLSGRGAIAGTTLSLLSSDVTFDDAFIGSGHVAVVGGASYEVVERLDATSVTISRVRSAAGDPILMPSPVADASVEVTTFAPQRALVQRQVVHLLGLETLDDLEDPQDLSRLESLGTLHLVFSAASALAGPESALGARAELYRERFLRERDVVRVHVRGEEVARVLGSTRLVRE